MITHSKIRKNKLKLLIILIYKLNNESDFLKKYTKYPYNYFKIKSFFDVYKINTFRKNEYLNL
jgi:hypothetical protein